MAKRGKVVVYLISKEELIYHFTDIYLSAAMECSICKENYEMVDDREFLDEYLKLFSYLLVWREKAEDLSLDVVKTFLDKRRQEQYQQFWRLMKQKIAEEALEATRTEKNVDSLLSDNSCYSTAVNDYLNWIFDENSVSLMDKPEKLLEWIREKEESYRK